MDWDDPNLLIGKEEVTNSVGEKLQKQVGRASDYSCLSSDTPLGIELIFGDLEARAPITIQSSNEKSFNWVLADNPDQWRFVPNLAIINTNETPSKWGAVEFVEEMSHWPPHGNLEHTLENWLHGHYAALSLWLRFPLLPNSPQKEQLRQLLYHTELVHLKPHAELSEARRRFAYQIYPRSEFAQRAESEDHLWFCIEYSACLQKSHYINTPLPPGKDSIRTNITRSVRDFKAALKTGSFNHEEILTIEALQAEGANWRRHIADLVLQEAIRLTWTEDNSEDLKGCIWKYLDALSQYNGVVGHKEQHGILVLNRDGEYQFSRKGLKLPKPKRKPFRGKGRPSKGSM